MNVPKKKMNMIHDVILKRRSIVLFSSRHIKPEILKNLFEAALWAPSSNNLQPWRFIYGIKGDRFYDSLLSCLFPPNHVWASNAPVLLLTLAQGISDYNNQENIYAWHDTGMAYSNLVFQAISVGLSIHPMGGFDREKTRFLTAIPEGYYPVVFAALGYMSDSRDFTADLIEREDRQRMRKPLSEIIFHGKYGNFTPLEK
jgi:nitroreductase